MKIPRPTFAIAFSCLALSGLPLCAGPNQVIELWPEGVPGPRLDTGPEKMEGPAENITHVNRPTLTVCLPTVPSNGTALVDCPGGAYTTLAFKNNAVLPAQWLNSLGVTVFQLKYRVAPYEYPAALQDVLRAVRLVRSRAKEFGVLPDRVGVIGFSAGGHVAACAATLYDAPEGRTGAPLDAVSARPDFLILAYPLITLLPPYTHEVSKRALLGANPSPELVRHLSLELQVTKRTPPTFLFHTEEDKTILPANSLRFYEALWRAGVPAEMHLYQKGAHGVGIARKPGLGRTSGWTKQCEDWMRSQGLLTAN